MKWNIQLSVNDDDASGAVFEEVSDLTKFIKDVFREAEKDSRIPIVYFSVHAPKVTE